MSQTLKEELEATTGLSGRRWGVCMDDDEQGLTGEVVAIVSLAGGVPIVLIYLITGEWACWSWIARSSSARRAQHDLEEDFSCIRGQRGCDPENAYGYRG